MNKKKIAPGAKKVSLQSTIQRSHDMNIFKLHRDSPVAMHRQLAQDIRDAISSGVYKQGDKIPTEQELGDRHGVSRITARQAVMQLVQEGLLVRRQGKGSFVTARPVQHELLELHGFVEELVARGVNPETKLLEFSTKVPSSRITEHLKSGSKPLTSWVRLFSRKGEPFAVAWVYLGPQIMDVTRQVANQHASYQIIESFHKLKIDHADISIRAQASNAQTRKLLRMPPGTPLIALERISYLADGTPIEYALYCAHADAYEYSFRVNSKVNAASALAKRTG